MDRQGIRETTFEMLKSLIEETNDAAICKTEQVLEDVGAAFIKIHVLLRLLSESDHGDHKDFVTRGLTDIQMLSHHQLIRDLVAEAKKEISLTRTS